MGWFGGTPILGKTYMPMILWTCQWEYVWSGTFQVSCWKTRNRSNQTKHNRTMTKPTYRVQGRNDSRDWGSQPSQTTVSQTLPPPGTSVHTQPCSQPGATTGFQSTHEAQQKEDVEANRIFTLLTHQLLTKETERRLKHWVAWGSTIWGYNYRNSMNNDDIRGTPCGNFIVKADPA